MIQHIKQLIMTLALLVTAAASAWADNLYVDIDGTGKTATMYWGDAGTKPKYSPFDGFADGQNINEAVLTIETLTIDASCQNYELANFNSLFKGWFALTTINNIENLKTEGVENMGEMFRACPSLQTVDLSGWNTAKVWNMSNMFAECTALENIYVGDGWSTAAVTNGSNMFAGCSKLPNWNGTVTHAMAKLTDDGGYLQTKPIELTWDEATKTARLAEMPEGNLTVNVEYMSLAGVTLNVSGTGGTAQLLDQTYQALSPDTKLMETQRFVLMVNKMTGYDFSTSFSKGGEAKDFMKEFTKEEYRAYIAWAKEQGITVPTNLVMKWVTMPDTDDETLTLGLTFGKQKTYTLLYKGEATEELWCRFAVEQGGEVTSSYAQMYQNSKMGNDAVWGMKMYSAFDPTKVAFFGTEAEAAADGAAMNNVSAMNSWQTITGGQYQIVGGNATTVVAGFVTDASGVPMYNSETANITYNRENPGVTYQVVVCQINSGNVTPTNVYLPAAPTAPQGKQFAGWRVLTGTAPNKTEKILSLGEYFAINENTTFTAVWKPIEVTTTFALNGGTGSISPVTKNYGEALGTITEPTRKGFVFDKWTVMKAVTESGIRFGKDSEFDLSKGLTENLALQAQWKHVHEYTSYAISRFGDALAAYQKYNGIVHISVCGCNDLQLVAHEFNAAGKCVCGYIKPGAQPVTLEPMYGKLSGSTYTNFANGFPETVKKGDEVTVDAPHNWGNLEFQKWQYSTDGGATWDDLAAFEIVGFLIPCNMKARACYVNPVTAPTVEISSSDYLEPVEYQGHTYKMGNILYQMNYSLPDGYQLLDAGIRMGDNDGISYYEEKERTYSYDGEAKAIAVGVCVGLSILNGEPTTMDMSATENYWANRENSVLDEFSAEKLAQYMLESKPVNVKKYEPIYWEAQAKTKGLTGSIATLPPTRFAQKNNQDHYIYGIGYIRYKRPGGSVGTLCTPAIAATVNNPHAYQSITEGSSSRQVNADFSTEFADKTTASRRANRVPAVAEETLDLSTVTSAETQLVVYVDGKYEASLSDIYGYGSTVTIKAPSVDSKTFSYWTADGAIVSTDAELTLTMKANTTLRAIYDAADVPAQPSVAILSATRSNDGEKIVLQGIVNEAVEMEAGFVISSTVAEPTLQDGTILSCALSSSQATTESSHQTTAKLVDANNCWHGEFTPDDANTVYHVRAFVNTTNGTKYGEVRDVKLATLKSGMKLVANIASFDNNAETGIDALLKQLQDAGQIPAGYQVEVGAGEFATFYAANNTLFSDDTPEGISRYTIADISADHSTATLAALNGIVAKNTPMLIYNSTDDDAIVSIRRTDDDAATNPTAIEQFRGTDEDLDVSAADMQAADFYACTGLHFVWVKDAGTISANRCWLQFQKEQVPLARSISLVFEETTGVNEVIEVNEVIDDSWYDLNGRKINAPAKKGVYILRSAEGRLQGKNGRKVVK